MPTRIAHIEMQRATLVCPFCTCPLDIYWTKIEGLQEPDPINVGETRDYHKDHTRCGGCGRKVYLPSRLLHRHHPRT